MIKILFAAFYTDKNIFHFNEDSGNVVFTCNKMGVINVNLNSINLCSTNYDEDDPDTIILLRLLIWHIKFEKCKALKKKINEEIMSLACHPKRWRKFCVS